VDNLALLNTFISILNYGKNLEEEKKSKSIEKKIDKILEILRVKNEID
jgi:hypothetical protein